MGLIQTIWRVLTKPKTIVKVAQTGGKLYSEATFNAFKNQLSKDGIKSLLKTQAKIQRNLSQHLEKLSELKKSGGF